MENAVYVFINKLHDLYPEQKWLLRERFGNYAIYPLDVKDQTVKVMDKIVQKMAEKQATVIFATPVPYLIKKCALLEGRNGPIKTLVFQNTNRTPFRAYDGKIVTIARESGWEII